MSDKRAKQPVSGAAGGWGGVFGAEQNYPGGGLPPALAAQARASAQAVEADIAEKQRQKRMADLLQASQLKQAMEQQLQAQQMAAAPALPGAAPPGAPGFMPGNWGAMAGYGPPATQVGEQPSSANLLGRQIFLQGLGSAFSSDEQNKEVLAAQRQGNREALGPVQPVAFRYKPEVAAAQAGAMGTTPAEQQAIYQRQRSPQVGVLAQQLEQAPQGRAVVQNTPAGKVLDRDKALGFALAASAGLDKRVSDLERRLRKATGRK